MHIQFQECKGGVILHFGQMVAPVGCYIQRYYLATLYIDSMTNKIRALTLPTENLPARKDRKAQKEYLVGPNIMVLSFCVDKRGLTTVSSSEYCILFNVRDDIIHSVELLDYTCKYNWLLDAVIPPPQKTETVQQSEPVQKTETPKKVRKPRLRYQKESPSPKGG